LVAMKENFLELPICE